jgi:COP9 signalosome complex subunit 1
MDTTLPDAGPAQTSLSAAQGSGSAAYEAANEAGASASRIVPKIKVDDPPKFEIESYIANYTGRTRFHRLYLIGTTSTLLATDVLKAAVAEAKSGKVLNSMRKPCVRLQRLPPQSQKLLLTRHGYKKFSAQYGHSPTAWSMSYGDTKTI